VKRKRDRHALQVELALREWDDFLRSIEEHETGAAPPRTASV
jgi:hypothetical protein